MVAVKREDYKFVGDFATEPDAMTELDRLIDESGMFRVFREVQGYYMAARPERQAKDARIDRILVPTKEMQHLGWTATIGIEGKRSGADMGPAICQAIDYTWAVFRCGSIYLYPEYIFLWPAEKATGVVASIMAQNRIGVARPPTKHRGLNFIYADTNVITFHADKDAEIQQPPGAGRKTGSR